MTYADILRGINNLQIAEPPANRSSKPLQQITNIHDDDVHVLARVNEELLVTGSKDTTVAVWDQGLSLKKRISPSTQTSYTSWVTALLPISEADRILVGSRDGIISSLSIKTHALVSQILIDPIGSQHKCKTRNANRINCFGVVPEKDTTLFLTGLPTTIQTRELSSLEQYDSTKISANDWIYCIRPLQKNTHAVVIGSDIELWENYLTDDDDSWSFRKIDSLYKEKADEIVGNQRPHIASCEFLQDNTFTMALFSGHVKVLDIPTKTVTFSQKEHTGRVWTTCRISDHTFASGADDRLVKIWDDRQTICCRTLSGHSGRVSCSLLLTDNSLVVTSCPDVPHESRTKASFTVWDLRV